MTTTYFLNEFADSISSNKTFTIEELAQAIGGEIHGSCEYKSPKGFTGIFETLNEAVEGDIVIRHWINGKGVEIANDKNVACLITLTPKEDALEVANNLKFPVIVVDRIEFANAFALKWVISNLLPNSKRVVISGTNGKSTSSHLIYHILSHAGYKVFTNTDAKSEFNTLIDPMVAKLISEHAIACQPVDARSLDCIADIPDKEFFDYLVIEVSEVQGWGEDLMVDHAFIMSSAIEPDVAVATNVAMDHIGLVNSIEEVFRETSGIVRATEKGGVVLNLDDENVLKMGDMVNPGVQTYYTSMDKDSIESYDADEKSKVYFDDDRKAIIYDGEAILKYEELPFTSTHFIRNILSAISACISLAVPIEDIASDPIIIDDFAHNPDGIKNTVRAASALVDEQDKDNLHVVCAIRGSRGKTLNGLNAKALTEVIHDLKHETGRKLNLILSSSADVVDHLNFVNECERKVFMHHLDEGRIKYTHYEYLFDALSAVLESACENDVILLIGAQGMDPAEEVLNDIRGSN